MKKHPFLLFSSNETETLRLDHYPSGLVDYFSLRTGNLRYKKFVTTDSIQEGEQINYEPTTSIFHLILKEL